ncbi:MAG: hypothetical protein NZM37_00575 [Sandaracinaceae bacterium]|nr:hypothetical protein [Sandaracinaceae bacterium]
MSQFAGLAIFHIDKMRHNPLRMGAKLLRHGWNLFLFFLLLSCGGNARTQVILVLEPCPHESGLSIQYEISGRAQGGSWERVFETSGSVMPSGKTWRIALAPRNGEISREFFVKIEVRKGSSTWASKAVKGGYAAGQLIVKHVPIRPKEECNCNGPEGCQCATELSSLNDGSLEGQSQCSEGADDGGLARCFGWWDGCNS